MPPATCAISASVRSVTPTSVCGCGTSAIFTGASYQARLKGCVRRAGIARSGYSRAVTLRNPLAFENHAHALM